MPAKIRIIIAILLLLASPIVGASLALFTMNGDEQTDPAGRILAEQSQLLTEQGAESSSPLLSPSPPALPATLDIPSLGVAAPIEFVGEDEQGNMDVPKAVNNVAWYQYGYIPGAPGNAVIAGHLDSTTGPAIFYELETLKAGDDIFVTGTDGKKRNFKVTHTATYPADSFPINEVFSAAAESHLNLITCEGIFDQTTKNYSERTVVYSRLVE